MKIPAEPVHVPSNDQFIHKHVVKQGDSLWKLSKAWGVSLKEMIDANPQLKNPNALLVGEVVNIPKSGNQVNAPDDANANANAHPDKVLPGGKAFTGPKEEMTAPKAEVTAPINVVPQQLPELPNLPNIMPEMNVPNIMPNVMPEMNVPNIMPNVMPEMTMPNIMPNVMPEMTMPNIMPNVMPEMTMPNVKPNVMPEMTMPNVKPNVMPEMTMPNVMPNVMPFAENKPMAIKPAAEEPYGCDDNYFVGGAQHPFMHYPTPVQEVGSFYNMPCENEVMAEHTYNNMPYPGKTSNYPGIVESAEDVDYDYMPNQSWVSPYSHAPEGGHWDNHWENHQSPVVYEPNMQPNMQSPVSHHPNQPFPHPSVSPAYYEPVHALPYNPCGCSGVSPAYHAPEPAYVEPMYYHHQGGYPHFALPPWCYPYPAPVVSPYETAPNAQLGAYSHEPNMQFHDPNNQYPGWGGMEYPHWDRTQAYAYPPETEQTESVPSANVNSVQAPATTIEAVEMGGGTTEVIAEPAQKVKTLSSNKKSSGASREKAVAKKTKKQVVSSKRKNPWING
ncbi:LysM peptidoglycan-binding domain-containing protein [Paenibacillus chibensis]|uniref:LysM peptidoglycan-binding domain-containing protein n=1 Tax=Paenibacillus chibensis TaxID=59846 RepID=A0ABU6PP60_9BACL|nr:LysM peptidoglycan-binding domain-containing protein [Paenibacillus chibensis]